jgi:hypothetical protein
MKGLQLIADRHPLWLPTLDTFRTFISHIGPRSTHEFPASETIPPWASHSILGGRPPWTRLERSAVRADGGRNQASRTTVFASPYQQWNHFSTPAAPTRS